MEVGFELWPVAIVATDDEAFPSASLEVGPQPLGNCLEVLERLLGHAAFGMAGFVAVVAVTRSAAREHVDNGTVFAQDVEAKIKETRALAIEHHNAEGRLGSQQCRPRFQLELRLEINLSGSEMRRQFVLLPEILSGAGEDCLSPGIPAQVCGQIEDAIQVGVKGSVLTAGSSALEGLLNDIFGDDCLAAMGAILRRIGLKVKTQGASPLGLVRLKSRQLTDFVPGHHLHTP